LVQGRLLRSGEVLQVLHRNDPEDLVSAFRPFGLHDPVTNRRCSYTLGEILSILDADYNHDLRREIVSLGRQYDEQKHEYRDLGHKHDAVVEELHRAREDADKFYDLAMEERRLMVDGCCRLSKMKADLERAEAEVAEYRESSIRLRGKYFREKEAWEQDRRELDALRASRVDP
jgi:hypothetical protein